MTDEVVLTRELLHAGGGPTGCGWRRAQLAALGVPCPPKKGWLSRLVGKRVGRAAYVLFLALGRRRRADQPSLFEV